ASNRKQPDYALEQVEVLCRPDGSRGHLLEHAGKEFFAMSWTEPLSELLKKQLDQKEYYVGKVWVQSLRHLGFSKLGRMIEIRLDQGPISNEAFIGMLDEVLNQDQPRACDALVQKGREQLRADTWAWGSVGRVLNR